MLLDEVEETALETIPADPEMKNIPDNIASMFAAHDTTLTVIPQSKYTCVTQEKLPIPPASTSDPLSL
jgi:hypothetical protein